MSKFHKPDILAAGIGVVAMAIGAQVKVSLGSDVVPFILSDFFAVLTALVAGAFWGPIAVFLYLILGILGIPVFAEGGKGLEVMTGPTGGYLWGFLLGSLVIAALTYKRYEWYLNLLGAIGAFGCILVLGMVWLKHTQDLDWLHAYRKGIRPFWFTAFLKIFSAWILGAIIRPRINSQVLFR